MLSKEYKSCPNHVERVHSFLPRWVVHFPWQLEHNPFTETLEPRRRRRQLKFIKSDTTVTKIGRQPNINYTTQRITRLPLLIQWLCSCSPMFLSCLSLCLIYQKDVWHYKLQREKKSKKIVAWNISSWKLTFLKK